MMINSITIIRNQWTFAWILLLLTVDFGTADYNVPPAKVEVFYPKGFRVSIPGMSFYVLCVIVGHYLYIKS